MTGISGENGCQDQVDSEQVQGIRVRGSKILASKVCSSGKVLTMQLFCFPCEEL